MRKYSKILLAKIEEYKTKKITLDELNDWSEKELTSYLNHREFIYYEKFEIYPFLSKLAISKDSLEHINESGVEEIYEILIGNSNMKYECYMKIPKETARSSIESIIELVDNYFISGKMSEIDLDLIEKYEDEYSTIEIKTFVDFLFYEIISILKTLPSTTDSEILINTLFISDNEIEINNIKGELNQLIQCYNSEKAFRINLMYNKGYSIINISSR